MIKIILAIFALLNVLAVLIYGMVQLFQASIMAGIYLTVLIVVLVYLGVTLN